MSTIIRVPDLRQQVYDAVRENIRKGQYPSDIRFYENTIAKEFGVSRTPAREALAMLVQDGLIVQDGRGFQFPQWSLAEIADVYEVRMRLEPFAVRRAVERAAIEDLRAFVETTRRDLKAYGSSNEYIQANRRIRDHLFGLTKNARLVSAIQSHEDYTHFIRLQTLSIPEIRAKSVAGMHRLADQIEKHDVEAAEIAMAQLLLAAREAIFDLMTPDPA